MRIRLIQAAQLDEHGVPIKYKKVFMPFLTVATLAALTPEGIDIGLTDEFVEDIDFDEDVDLVGITAQTCQAPRAYQIADEFRKRGRQTLIGGIHVSMCPEEALAHADAVLVGEAEDIWETILADAKSRNLKRIYRVEEPPNLSRLAIPRFDLIDFDNYVVPPFARTPLIPLQTTRGCPHTCDFCAVTRFLGRKIRKKPVAHVLKEIECINPSRVFFTDDNMIADPGHSRDLFIALQPLKLRWACQMSTQVAKYPELIDLAADAGCHETFIGIESLDERNLKAANKGFNKVEEFAELFRRLRQVGILAQASLIFGFDHDTKDSLRRVVDRILQWDINYLYIQMLIPLPGTPFFIDMQNKDRIRVTDWSRYDGTTPLLDFAAISPGDLEEAIWQTYQRFYSCGNILKRAWRFRREYLRFFPRDFAPEEVFFQFHMRSAVNDQCHPFSLGLRE